MISRHWWRIIPAVTWLRRYGSRELSSDLVAAIIVTIMLIPQSLAYAMLAGLPAQVGLYASILPLVAYALFGSSRALAVGPVAVVSLLTAAAISRIAEPGTEGYLGAAVALALLSGMMLLTMGLLRLGFLANLLSHPVISGFITASGILIAVSQLKHILGVDAHGHTLVEMVSSLARGLERTHGWTLLLGTGATVFLFWVRTRLKPLLRKRVGLPPFAADILAKAGPVAAVVVTTGAVALFDLDAQGVAVVGDIPQGLPPLTLPPFDLGLWSNLAISALLISLIGFVESVSVAQTLAAKKRQRIDANQELTGLGAANIASAFSGGFPVTGGFSRSVVNFDAGAETPMAGVFTAVGIAATALLFTPLFQALPKATLAATIIVAVLSLVDLGAIRRTYRYSRTDFAAMAATIFIVLGVGVEAGVVTGVALSLALHIWRTSRPHAAVVGQVPGTEHFRNVERHSVVTSPQVLTLRVDESLYFANARYLEDTVYDLIARSPEVSDVILMCSAVNVIDASALESLEAINARLADAGVTFHLSEVKGPVMDNLQRSPFLEELSGRIFLSQYQAMETLAPDTIRRARAASAA
ncbi:sodium-independent anion transporter [Rhodovibrio sodomensis]|uniref:Sodium-independent anion transporter n=1 Tax=Rhodovibrio sodomensis TaxID=1088 RepID=A0ABS1DHP3_9PROT|nr:sulfate permease [Rhodovibrio sodomensis]MBK1669734.1 sodium-independent anion transporter [Rhodovibrio sodomensis]